MDKRRDAALLVQRHRTVGRVVAILEAAAVGDDGVRLRTLTELLEAPKSSIYGLLKGLVSVGYLVERDGRYTLGPAIHGLLGAAEQPSLGDLAAGPMHDLRSKFDETVMLGHRMGDSIVYLHAVESHQLIRYSPKLNQRRPVLPTSMGKIYLAELERDDLEAYLEAHVSSRRRRKELVEQLAEVAATGVGVNRNETLPGVCGVAAGIRERGELAGCLSVVGPSDRMVPQLKRVSAAVRQAADKVTTQLP